MKYVPLLLVLFSIALVGCAPQSTETSDEATDLAEAAPAPERSPLEGAWQLTGAQTVAEDGTTTELAVQENLVLFTGTHYSMAWSLLEEPFPQFAERWNPTEEEKAARFWSLLMNAGTFEVTGSSLTTRPLVALMPGFVGGEADHDFAVAGDTLTLTTTEARSSDGVAFAGTGSLTTYRLVRVE